MTTAYKPEALYDLLRKGRLHRLPKGQIIQSSDEWRNVLHFINKGYVKRYLIGNDGSLGTQFIYGPGHIFPITLIFKNLLNQRIIGGPEVYYYEAITDTEIYNVDIPAIKEVADRDPTLYKDLMFVAGQRLYATLHGLENQTLQNSYKRIAHQLAFFATEYGKKKSDGTHIAMHLTHQDIADLLSLTRETVSNGMVELRKQKLIKTGKEIVVPSINALLKEAFS